MVVARIITERFKMPAKSEARRRFFGAELARLREGEKTRTGMSEEQLRDFAKKRRKRKKTSAVEDMADKYR